MRKSTVLFFLLFVCFLSANAQGLLRRAEIAYNEKNYLYAADAYQRFFDRKGDVDPTISANLANCYYQLNNFEDAQSFYKKVDKDLLDAQACYNYGRLELMLGFYESAIDIFTLALKKKPEKELTYLINIGKSSAKWAIENNDAPSWTALVYDSDVEVNGHSLGLQYYYDGVVYAYGDTTSSKKSLDERGMPILNLSYVTTTTDAYISSPMLFSKNLESDSHVGAIDFGNNGRTLYFSKLDRVGSNRKSRIYSSYFNENTSDWTDGVMLTFCIDDFNYAHPALSKDGNTMFFSSDASGQGGMDLFKVERDKRGAWGRPKNLGRKINTKGDELFPYVTPQDVLTFSSNGHKGFGGLDVFWAPRHKGNFVSVDNAMKPINSSFDDFALVINPNDTLTAYVSSNRDAKGKLDKIHAVDLKRSYYAQMEGLEVSPEDEQRNENVFDPSGLSPFGDDFFGGNTAVDEQADKVFGFDVDKAQTASAPVRRTHVAIAPAIQYGPTVRRFVYDPSVDTTNTIKTLLICALSFEPIANADYEVLDAETSKVLHKGVSDANGQIYINKDNVDVDKNLPLKLLATGGDCKFDSYRIVVMRSDLKIFDLSGVVHLMPVLDSQNPVTQTHYDPIVVDDEVFGGAPFEVNQVELTKIGKSYLDAWVAFLVENPTVKIKMMVHTDQRGIIDYNFRLSQKRAFEAKSYLIKRGVDHKQIVARGYGERYPLVECKGCSEEEYARNRRVVIELMEDAN